MSETFAIKARLITNNEQEFQLNKLIGIYCHIQNVMIKHAKSCITNLERDNKYRATRGHKLSKEEKQLCQELLLKYGLNKYMFHKYVAKQTKLFKGQANSHIAQKISDRVWEAVESYIYKNGKELHFKQRRKYKSFVNKNILTGIKSDGKTIKINNICLPIFIRRNDQYLKDILKNNRIKYYQIKREWHKHKYRFYVIFYLEGHSNKQYPTANGNVGIDIGPSTIAYDSEKETNICELGPNVISIERELFILNRRLDRQRRANNPQNYNEDGTIKKDTKTFKKCWYKSKRMKVTEHKIKELYQKRTNRLNQAHNILAKYLLTLGDNIIIEDMHWSALAKKAKKTKKNDKGRYKKKKRFGKSIANHAPSKLITLLKNKALICGVTITEVDCFKTCATQYDHTTGEFVKHPLYERMIKIGNDKVQRDLHSAFNLRHILSYKDEDEIVYHYDNSAMETNYSNFKKRHDICMSNIKELRKAGNYIPA